jgi:hypothetical protein
MLFVLFCRDAVAQLLIFHLKIFLHLPAADLTFVSTKVSKTICGAKLAIHGSNSCATASLPKTQTILVIEH